MKPAGSIAFTPKGKDWRKRAWPALGWLALASCGALMAIGALNGQEADKPPSKETVAKKLGVSVQQVQRLNTQRALSDQALMRLPVEKLPRVVRRLDYPDLPRERIAFRLLQERDEKGVIPAQALPRAIRQLNENRQKVAPKPRTAGVPTGVKVVPKNLLPALAGLKPGGGGWAPLGPGNVGGRTRAIVIHPSQPDTMWAGSPAGGVWRTDNGGKSWFPADDFMANLAVSCLTMDPTNPDVLYAGTGEGFYNVDAIRGGGIFRTTDGQTWSQLPATATANFQYVNRLALSADGKVLLAATRSGVFRSTDPDRLKWAPCLNAEVADLDFHPKDAKRAIAGSLRDGKAYFSSNGGETWTEAAHGDGVWSGRVELCYARQDPSIVYASVNAASGQVWRSKDGGQTYELRNTGLDYLGEQGWYDNAIWAGDPANADLVLVGGIDLWRSTNGGTSFTQISQWWSAPDSAHADHHVIVAHPQYGVGNNRTVFFGNDGGVYRAGNVTTVSLTNGWQELNNTYGVTQFYGAAGFTKTDGSVVIVGGTQDNGTLRFATAGGAELWTEMFGGDGGYCAADPADANYFYGEYVYLNIHRSSDGGLTSDFISGQYWNGLQWAWKPFPYHIPDAKNQQANFIAPFIIDPNNANRILGGGMRLWRTNDAKTANTNSTGPAWASIKQTVGSPISAIAVAQGNADLIWVGHNNGDVYVTTGGTGTNPPPTWAKADDGPNPLPDRYCTRVTIDRTATSRVYITFGGYTKDNVWRTADGGKTWTNLGANLPEAPVRALVIHPKNAQFLYIGTEVGIFASEDGGTTWSPTNEGPTNCSVDELFWMGTTLVAATHGRGLFKIDLPLGGP